QLRPLRARAPPRRDQLPRQGRGRHLARALRVRRRRRRPHARDARAGAPHRRPRGLAARDGRAPARLLRGRRGRVRGAAGLGGRAVPGDAPGDLHDAGAHQAGQPRERAPAAGGRAVGRHRRGPRRAPVPRRGAAAAVAHRAARPVPRHPAGQLDLVGVPRHARRARPRAGAAARDRRREPAAAGGRRRPADHLQRGTARAARRAGAGRCGRRAGGRRRPGRRDGRRRRARARRAAGRRRPRRPGDEHLGQGGRARGRAAGAARQPAAAAPGLPEPVRRLGRRPLLPQQRRRHHGGGPGRDVVGRDVGDRRGAPHPRGQAGRADAPGLHVGVEVEWAARDRFLKLAFPVDVHTDHARFEVQMGHLTRPTHTNTSWDFYRFEVWAHRWLHVAEPGYGVALANEATYGYDLIRHPREGGGTFHLVRASLLRGPGYPDPRTDHGSHRFGFVLLPGAGVEDAVAAGYATNLPLRQVTGAPVDPLVTLDGGALVEAVKLAHDGSGDVVVRLYEPYGRRSTAQL